MDVLLENVIAGGLNHDPASEAYLKDVLQLKSSYDDYFSSLPIPGSIVEEIAETDAKMAQLELELRSLLLDNKTTILKSSLDVSVSLDLNNILKEMDELWELRGGTPTHKENHQFDDTLAALHKERPAQETKDGFAAALQNLKIQESTGTHVIDDLGLALDNMPGVNDILELPSLVAVCIKMGHYNEAILCHVQAQKLAARFPDIEIIKQVVSTITEEITTNMLQGLVRLLETNSVINTMKKTVGFLHSIPPFTENDDALLQVFLTMRFNFIYAELRSYDAPKDASDAICEMLMKRKIEAIREHAYNAFVVISSISNISTQDIALPIFEELQPAKPTNLSILVFVKKCIDMLVADLNSYKSVLSESVCLQLIYCSFRFADSNPNYHRIFIQTLWEKNIFTKDQLLTAMEKRRDLATKYH
ncbi:LAMI_0G09472g1_1 [Lachancea mirantina]|uniref:Conserved oligomeric Golgi complex subunit 8 n=1 Tax=Lachancea mirantina TaxID=1230905 RepID=A0A1G4KAA7_9SACH|nr:LAMI_0G09472g1_1 [Lachancea mirantina]